MVEGYREAVEALDWAAVKADIREALTSSQDFWPADYGHYGPLMIRLAWHCAGSYRESDGLGGCDGGRIRVDPERSWGDNGNLDKARRVLQPIKAKYGLGLSWGDLIILTGNEAIEMMGGPVVGFCGGRVDEADGFWSEELGTNAQQQAVAPCFEGDTFCQPPFGAVEINIIYVNPGGPGGNSTDFLGSAAHARSSFGRMGMNDTETAALIAGGHAFGKGHGACPDGPGPSPAEQPTDPWPGLCGTGNGVADRATSGFEATWTATPTNWSNLYSTYLTTFDYTQNPHVGPAGKTVWRQPDEAIVAPLADGSGTEPVAMYTSDVALVIDPDYRTIVEAFAADFEYLNVQFSEAWYKLTTRDMGPYERCLGPDVPDVRDFQFPLPEGPMELPDFDAVSDSIRSTVTNLDGADGSMLVRLALRSASTFRITDYRGGPNGARILLSPEKDWAVNDGLDAAVDLLQPVKDDFGDALSWADLIVLAGNLALQAHGSNDLPFCGGRTDAADGAGSANLEPRHTGHSSDSLPVLKHMIKLSGLTTEEYVATLALNAIGQMHPTLTTYDGSASNPLTTDYFTQALATAWEDNGSQFVSPDGSLSALSFTAYLRFDEELGAFAERFAADEAYFKRTLATAWTKLMTADRFDGPDGNECAAQNAQLENECTCEDSPTWISKGSSGGAVVKDCAWVATFPSGRCTNRGDDQTFAAYSCPVACGTDCLDSLTWHRAGDDSKDCAWVSRLADRQTNVRCALADADGLLASEACPTACASGVAPFLEAFDS